MIVDVNDVGIDKAIEILREHVDVWIDPKIYPEVNSFLHTAIISHLKSYLDLLLNTDMKSSIINVHIEAFPLVSGGMIVGFTIDVGVTVKLRDAFDVLWYAFDEF